MAETKMQLVDWLDDLCVRFIINLPQEELESVERICFQAEEAQWFYEDFIRPLDPSLPSMNLRRFCLLLFQHCPLFAQYPPQQHEAAYEQFLAYKTWVPVRGAILLNEAMDEVLLVKGWKKGARWSFPRGKINKGEKDLDCAIREVYEETGFELREAGLVKSESDMKYIDVSMRDQQMRLYVFRDVPMDYHFEARTRKEISDIRWFRLSELPTLKKGQQQGSGEDLIKGNKFFMVAPFLGPLKRWIKEQRKQGRRATSVIHSAAEFSDAHADIEEVQPVEEERPETAEKQTAVERLAEATGAPTGHLDRLLAGLRNPRQTSETSLLPEAQMISPPVSQANGQVSDPVAELKRILNVKQPDLTPPVSGQLQPAPANDLLAILKNGSSSFQIHPGVNPPRTPFDQVVASPSQPRTPHHEHPRPPALLHSQPPPAFPYSPAQAVQAQHPHHQHLEVPPGFATVKQHHRSSLPQDLPNPPFSHQQVQQRSAMHGPTLPQYSQTMPRSYQRPSDQQIPQSHQFPNVHGAAPPPPSKLPLPKLNDHTSALLNAFKSPRIPTNPVNPATNPIQAEASSSGSTRPNGPSENKRTILGAPGAQLLALFGSKPAAPDESPNTHPSTRLASNQTVPAQTALAHDSPEVGQAASRPRSAHQDTLLKLFQPPTASTSRQSLEEGLGAFIAQAPVGLPAQVNTGMRPNDTVSARPVAGPPPLHRFNTAGPSTIPTQMQKRPPGMMPPQVQSSALTAIPSQVQVQHMTTGPSQVPAKPVTRVPAFDRRENVGNDQKHTLLSLFTKPTAPQPSISSAARVAASPALIDPMAALSLNASSGNASPLPMGHVSEQAAAVSSAPASKPAARLNSIGSLADTAPGAKSGSGSQTPTTPAANNAFLLNYLDNVIRSAKK